MEVGRILLNGTRVDVPLPARNLLVMRDSIQHHIMRSLFDSGVGEVVFVTHGVVIIDNCIVDHRSGTIVVNDRLSVDVGNSDVLVVINSIEVVLPDHYRTVDILVAVDIDIGDIDVIDNQIS